LRTSGRRSLPGFGLRIKRPRDVNFSMNEQVLGLLKRLKQELQRIYGPRLKGAYVFGSYARGEAHPESDLDVLIVLDKVGNYCAEVNRTSAIMSGLSLQNEISLSGVYVPESDWLGADTSFLRNVREEAAAI